MSYLDFRARERIRVAGSALRIHRPALWLDRATAGWFAVCASVVRAGKCCGPGKWEMCG